MMFRLRLTAMILLAVATLQPMSVSAEEPPGYRNGNQLDLIGGQTDPRYHDTGYFLETDYGRYTYRNAHAHFDVSFGTLATKAGLFDKLAGRAFEFRATAVQPILHGEVPFALVNEWTGELQIGLAASYNHADYNTDENVDVVQGGNTYRIYDLNTHLWGFGPDARFLFPPGWKCIRPFVGARFEGLGGWANPDATLLAGPTAGNGTVTAKTRAEVGKSDEVWGMRGEWSAGLMFQNEMTVSGSFSATKLRSKVIDGLENNNDSTSWSVNIGVPTEVIFSGMRRFVSRIGF